MHVKSLKVKNFRALEDIDVDFDSRVNVIVGPNAVGKTTVLEAIRLVKSLLSPRTQNESMQVLFSLGASSPHLPQQISLAALARNQNLPVVIGVRFELSQEEIEWLEASIQLICRGLVQARMGQAFMNPLTLVSFLSTQQGQDALESAQLEVQRALAQLKDERNQCRIQLTISQDAGVQATDNSIWPTLLGMLDQRHPSGLTNFSYFPADRALPRGEQPIQVGMADAQAQLESHFSQPHTKYARLKNTIFNAMLMSEDGRAELTEEFTRIFSGILKGRRLGGFKVNHLGLLSIVVQDTESGREFEIDGMSSGEKGLILTFLLIERSVTQDGLILLDEPELHLNPAVCKDLLSFLVESYAVRKNLQVFVCSHSPEILAGAFDSDECSLYHLESEKMLTKVRRQDQTVISEALRRLGTSESEGLLYQGTIFVEGVDDIAVLEAGFGPTLRRFKVKDLGGRREVEKEIRQLQDAEKKGEDLTPRYFIFDRDEMPTNLQSSRNLKVLQWERRCLENYLIDFDVLADLLMNGDVVQNPLNSVGDVRRELRHLAFSQIDDFVAKQVYLGFQYIDPGIRSGEIQGKGMEAIADILIGRLSEIKRQLSSIDEANWKEQFIQKCEEERERIHTEWEQWEQKWVTECDGKRLFHELCQKVTPRNGARKFKIRVISEMRLKPTENWRTISGLLNELLAKVEA